MNPTYVMNEDWDYLIILDACRYDYFEKYYKKYLPEGVLKKIKSPATWTLEWAEKNFIDYYDDIIYISSVPFINSFKKVSWHGNKFNAKNHFFKVVDGWDKAWDEEIAAIAPKNISKLALREIDKHPEKRCIIHYCQPHAPYLTYKSLNIHRKRKGGKTRFRKDTIQEKIKIFLANGLVFVGGTELIWKLNNFFNIMKPRYLEYIWREKGKQGIINGYISNLNVVLDELKKICVRLPGTIIITADHGEMLGEKKYYGHGEPIPRLNELIEVPWYIINNGKRNVGNEKRKLKSVLMKLKENKLKSNKS